MNYRALLLLLFITVPCADSLDILVMFPYPGKSHFHTFIGFFKALAQRGHKVTVVTHFPSRDHIPNYREIEVGGYDEFVKAGYGDMLDMSAINYNTRLIKYGTALLLADIGNFGCEIAFRSEAVQKILKDNNKFDIAITEYFNTDCLLTHLKQFNVPIVRVHSCTLMPWTSQRYGNPTNPAYIPNTFLLHSNEMTFLERVENTLLHIFHTIYFNNIVLKRDKRVSMKYFGELGVTLDQDVLNDSLLLIASHFSLNLPRPLVPKIIEVGGIHIGKPKPLPKNIEKWINESEHGVIYFSFGSLVKGHTMPAEKREAFIRAFKRLPQRVIWKWENDTMEGKTDNILIGKWLPQFDILSHPNVKAFISHGGLLGTFEAVHCGVPMLVMPQFGDQHTNAKALEAVGGGEILYLGDATEEKIYNALKKILSPSFQEQAKELSERFRDRPMSPLDTAIYWVEYVARHKGAHFMKTAAVGMPFYQYYLLDVIAFILAVLILFFYILYVTLRFFFRLIFKSNFTNKKEKVKKS